MVMAQGATVIQTKSGHAHGGARQPVRRALARRPRVRPVLEHRQRGRRCASPCTSAAPTTRSTAPTGRRTPRRVFGDFDAFQWMMYWGDRPAMELTAGVGPAQLLRPLSRTCKVCLSEQGTVWVPYTLRKMDHAFLMGRKAKWAENGRLDRRPSEIFRQHFIVAPFPEENVQRVVAEVGIEPIVFGSDFPHGEGLARPGRVRRRAARLVLRRR